MLTRVPDSCCRLTEDQARYYAAEVLLAFQYFHSKDIVYRDLKVGAAAHICNTRS